MAAASAPTAQAAGQGTRIRVRLPLARRRSRCRRADRRAGRTPAVPARRRRCASLLADDNVDAADLLAEFLRAEGL